MFGMNFGNLMWLGLTDKLGSFNNLSDVQNPDVALTNLGVTTAGKSFAKIRPKPSPFLPKTGG